MYQSSTAHDGGQTHRTALIGDIRDAATRYYLGFTRHTNSLHAALIKADTHMFAMQHDTQSDAHNDSRTVQTSAKRAKTKDIYHKTTQKVGNDRKLRTTRSPTEPEALPLALEWAVRCATATLGWPRLQHLSGAQTVMACCTR